VGILNPSGRGGGRAIESWSGLETGTNEFNNKLQNMEVINMKSREFNL